VVHAHACALTRVGGGRCGGRNDVGDLGDGTATDRYTPVAVAGLDADVVAIAVGYAHACALTRAGRVLCWGGNRFGELGDGTTVDRHTPVAVAGLGTDVIAIAAGAYDTCAVTGPGGAFCWGGNDWGQIRDR